MWISKKKWLQQGKETLTMINQQKELLKKWQKYADSAYIVEHQECTWTKKNGRLVTRLYKDYGTFVELDGKMYDKSIVSGRISNIITVHNILHKESRPGFNNIISILGDFYNDKEVESLMARNAPFLRRLVSK